jgi:hypothetical protein
VRKTARRLGSRWRRWRSRWRARVDVAVSAGEFEEELDEHGQ